MFQFKVKTVVYRGLFSRFLMWKQATNTLKK